MNIIVAFVEESLKTWTRYIAGKMKHVWYQQIQKPNY